LHVLRWDTWYVCLPLCSRELKLGQLKIQEPASNATWGRRIHSTPSHYISLIPINTVHHNMKTDGYRKC